ncbi:two-component system sensor histidine kinase NtrB [Tepidiforma sp.]|uniref:two-component system sensor histidine kinase NtrB n=1 Tax=Tepidiforma sp. TaxID=2682230 RepID=UPI002ADD3943|nr:ATP-binding protein [Tepidiforma sp.]
MLGLMEGHHPVVTVFAGGRPGTSWLEAAALGTPDGILLVDRSGAIRGMNGAAERIFGVREAEALGISVQQFVAPERREAHGELMSEFFRTAVSPREMADREPVEAVRADGQRFWADVSLIPISTEGGPGVVCIVRDVTARIEMEAQLRRAERLESLRMLSAGLAHDFNNVLAVVIGNAEFAMSLVAAESPARMAMQDIRDAAGRAAELVQQMMRFAGRMQSQRSAVELTGLTREMLHLLRGGLAANVLAQTDFADEPLVVQGDPVGLRQVVLNLVINAAEAMSRQGGRLTVRTGAQAVTRAYLRSCAFAPDAAPARYGYIEVADTGHGMDRETLSHVFDPFFTTKRHGRGLGLASVVGVVRDHHGAIHVASRPGHGTVFRVLIPLAEEPVAQAL